MIKKHKIVFIGLFFLLACIVFGTYWVWFLNRAHSSFENYYSFRGCIELLEKTETYATCKTASGETIKIVKFNDKWYLDGDLPNGWFL